MEPLTSLLAALVAGASTALQTTVADVVKDAYAVLKTRLAEHFGSVDLSAVERNPEEEDPRRALEEQLRETGAASDAELVAAAKALLEQLERHDPSRLASVVGVDLEGIKAGAVRIDDIISAGAGVRAKKVTASGDFHISGVRAGSLKEMPGKP
jgi:hypothetical protein